MLSLRIKYALAHLSRKEHTARLARPNWRRLRRIDPNVLTAPFKVPRSALRSRISRRIRIMAQPKYVTKKYDPTSMPPPYPRIHPKTLAAKPTKRIVDLALPKRRRKRMAKLRRALTKPEDWQRHMRVLERLAAPKFPAKPKRKKLRWKILLSKKSRPIDMERLASMALPVIRQVPDVKEPFTVALSALTYKISKRTERLAIRKKQPEILPRIPGTVSPAALKAIASERMIALAKPAQRPPGRETDLREDAFTVSPMALKAKCSKRLKILAKPKTYPKPTFRRPRLRTARKP
ncbi:hypothetical protein DMN91_004151 [Ooceraea biroi]|uniref:Testicular haploid expressed gene protein-like n=1 Tax=Ooceraea biroi TaxID=2015173 RepID=A0A3L8DUT8_OOCBI|nr:hypothetical protein DMN91_004151 [Ooceraea biroi]